MYELCIARQRVFRQLAVLLFYFGQWADSKPKEPRFFALLFNVFFIQLNCGRDINQTPSLDTARDAVRREQKTMKMDSFFFFLFRFLPSFLFPLFPPRSEMEKGGEIKRKKI